jgi:uncharacterized membrane protein HdeD (DUF308 family)
MEAVRQPLKAWIQKARKNAGRMILAGVLSVIAGILCIAHPALGSLSVTFIVGIMMIVGGIARMFGVFSADSFGHGLLALLGGILTLLAGLVTVAMPGLGLATLTLVLAIWLLVDGIAGTMLSFRLRPGHGWGWILVSSICAIILGGMLLAHWPWSGLVAIGLLAGINLLVSGFAMISIGSAVRRITA